jgi:hypothetical protein
MMHALCSTNVSKGDIDIDNIDNNIHTTCNHKFTIMIHYIIIINIQYNIITGIRGIMFYVVLVLSIKVQYNINYWASGN